MDYKPWSRTTRFIIIIVCLIGFVWLAVVINPLIQALVIAALLAYLLYPLVEWVEFRSRLNFLWSVRAVYGGILLVLIGIPALISALAWRQFDELQADFIAALAQLRAWLVQPLSLFGFELHPLLLLDSAIQTGLSAMGDVPGGPITAVLGVTTNLLWVLTVVVSLYYLLVEGHLLKPWLIGLIPPDYRTEFSLLLDDIDQVWRVFLRVQIIIFAIFFGLLGSSMFVTVWLYRIQLLPLSPIGLALVLVAIYIIVQNIDNVVVRPYFFGDSLHLHPGVVFVGLIAGIAFGGVLGVIIVIPLIATARVVGRYLSRRLQGLSPWPEEQEAEDVAGGT